MIIKKSIKDKKLVSYEMIIVWNTKKRPFSLQKLGFKAPPVFSLAYKEAKAITKLLWSAGGLSKKAVKLVAVGTLGIMEEFREEHAPWLKKQEKDLAKRVKEIASRPTKSADIKRIVKAKYNPEQDIEISKIKTNPKKKKKKPDAVKHKVAEKMEPMFDASKKSNSTKKKSKIN